MSQSTSGQKTSNLSFRFFSNASIYGLGSVFIRFGSLFILPLYWSVLTPEDFGWITSVQIITQLLLSILDMGLSGSIQRHFYEWEKPERPFHLAAVWSFSFTFSFLVCLFLTLMAGTIGQVFEVNMPNTLVYFGIWTAFFQNFGVLPISLFRIREQMKLFSLISIGQFLAQTGTTLIFLFVLKMGFTGYLWGSFLGAVVYGLSCLVYIYRQIQFPWRWSHLRDILVYALPTIPATILEGLGSTLDRFFLQKYVPLSQLGIYSLARQFGQAYNFFVGILKNSWVPLVYRIAVERTDAPAVLSRMSTYYLLVLIFPGVLVAVLSQEFIRIVNRPEYFDIAVYIPWFVLGVLITGIGHIHGRGLDLAKKTQYYWIIYAGQFLVNIGLLSILAPTYGIWGAIASFIAAQLAREILQISMAYYFYPRPFDLKAILKTLVVQIVSVALCFMIHIENPWIALLTKASLAAVLSGVNVAWVLGLPTLKYGFKELQKRIGR